jgi:hypothetical protein
MGLRDFFRCAEALRRSEGKVAAQEKKIALLEQDCAKWKALFETEHAEFLEHRAMHHESANKANEQLLVLIKERNELRRRLSERGA